MDYREIGNRIKSARAEKGLTQRDLAALVKNGKSTIAQWETGRRRISFDDLLRVAQALGKPIQFFLGLDFAGADSSRAAELMQEAKRRIDELMVAAAWPDLPGLLGEIVEAAGKLPGDKQRQVLEYAQLLAGAIVPPPPPPPPHGGIVEVPTEIFKKSTEADEQRRAAEEDTRLQEVRRHRQALLGELKQLGFQLPPEPPLEPGTFRMVTSAIDDFDRPDLVLRRADGTLVVVEIKDAVPKSDKAASAVEQILHYKRKLNAAQAILAFPAVNQSLWELGHKAGVSIMTYDTLAAWTRAGAKVENLPTVNGVRAR